MNNDILVRVLISHPLVIQNFPVVRLGGSRDIQVGALKRTTQS